MQTWSQFKMDNFNGAPTFELQLTLSDSARKFKEAERKSREELRKNK
jgi:hypothetical protein